MEAKELMIGDLCCEWNNDHTEKHVVKVTQIQKEGVRDRYNVFHENDWIEPIPWTVDSAKENGLVDCGDDIYQDDKRQWGVDFLKHEFYTFDEEVENTIKPILFYHELQHALRLVGLNEVADTLKV